MTKKFWTVASTAATALLMVLGFGSCHSKKAAAEAAERARIEAERQAEEMALQEQIRQDSIKQVLEQQRILEMKRKAEQHKVVYGPPPAPFQHDLLE